MQAIDAPLRNLEDYNNGTYTINGVMQPAPATRVKAKLRIWAGRNAPTWVLAEPGAQGSTAQAVGSVQTESVGYDSQNPSDMKLMKIARFWTPQYRLDWRSLMAMLGTQYDQDARIAAVSVTQCSTITDESFNQPLDQLSQSNMRTPSSLGNDAYVDSDSSSKYSGQFCLTDEAKNVADFFKITPIDFVFSPFHTQNSHGIMNVDDGSGYGLAENLMTTFRQTLFGQAITSQHSLQNPTSAALPEIYTALIANSRSSSGGAGLNEPMTLQTGSQKKISDNITLYGATEGGWDCTVAHGVDEGASEIEVWETVEGGAPGSTAVISDSQLSSWAATKWTNQNTRSHAYCANTMTTTP